MKIVDYSTSKTLNDVGIVLTRDEAEDLLLYLKRLTETNDVDHVYLSDYRKGRLERELTLAIDPQTRASVA